MASQPAQDSATEAQAAVPPVADAAAASLHETKVTLSGKIIASKGSPHNPPPPFSRKERPLPPSIPVQVTNDLSANHTPPP